MRNRIISLVLITAIVCAMLPVMAISTNAATAINSIPLACVEYNYSSTVSRGTIRYISQIVGSTYFNWSYWPTSSLSGYSGPGIECGTACISMALSYIGVNKTPSDILTPYDGWTKYIDFGDGKHINPSFAGGISNYVNGDGQYSPVVICLDQAGAYNPQIGKNNNHYIMIVGKVSDTTYHYLDPASNAIGITTISGSMATYGEGKHTIKEIHQWYTTRPGKPVLNHSISGKTITFTWEDTANTTHYNLWIETQNAAGEWEYVEQIFDAESGESRELSAGEYRAQLLSYNSNAYESDGSDWVHTYADEVFFAIGADKKITYYDATGNIWKTETCESGVNYGLLDSYPTCSDGYFSGWAYTQNAQEWVVRPGETLEVADDISLYPVYVSHSDAISGNAVQIYNIADFNQSGYNIEEVEVTVSSTENVGSWTAWSDYTTDVITPSNTVEVETTTLYKYYYFYCSNCGGREPFWGTSDCGASIPSTAWHIGWFTTPYSQCNHKTYSYTTIKYYTTSLGDGQIWNFSAGNLYDTAVGTLDAGGDTEVITTGYRSRTYIEQAETVERTVTAYKITPKSNVRYEVLYYPSRTEYWVGDPVDLTRFMLKATYEDGSTAIITDGFTVSGFDTDTIGPKTMLITYDGFTVAFNVTVSYGGVCGDNVLWNLDYQGTLTIFGTGDMYEHLDEIPWKDYRESIEKVVVQNGVTSISACAFIMCENLTSVMLPNSLTKIGMSAFSDCTSLTSITIPDSITCVEGGAFSGCDNLSYNTYSEGKYLGNSNNPYVVLVSITEKERSTYSIHPDTKIIGSAVFSDCANLASITIPDGVTCLGDNVFEDCSALTGITIPDSVTYIGSFAFHGCSSLAYANIPDGVTAISGYAFAGCESLASINIPEGVTRIDVFAFIRCRSLTSITLPSSLTYIQDWAFASCTGLTSVIIPEGVIWISYCGFTDCSGLTSIVIPDSITEINYRAFDGCDSLSTVIFCGTQEQWDTIAIDEGNEPLTNVALQFHNMENGACTICGYDNSPLTFTLNETGDGYVVSGCDKIASGEMAIPEIYNGLPVTSIGDWAFNGCTGLTDITIPAGVTSIGEGAFSSCNGLLRITIPNRVTVIGNHAFRECSDLTSITIPSSVTSIGSYAFQGCYSLASITIPKGVNSIGDVAFSGCTGLTSIAIPDSITSIGKFAFHNCAGLTSVTYCGTQEQWDAIELGDENERLTNAALQFHNYENGICTACGAADLKFYRANASSPYGQLKLTGEVIAYVTAARKGFDSYYVVFTYDNQGNTVTVTAEPSASSDANYVLFDCAIPAPLMTADITATIYGVKDGVAYRGETIVYTIRECVDAKLNMWYASYGKNAQIAKLFDTLVNLLNYGAQAQTRFGVNTDKLATDGLPAEYAAKIKMDPVELNAYPAVDESGKAATLYNMSFKLQEKINMYGNFLVKSGFTAASDYTVKIVHTKADGTSVTYTITDLTKSGNYLYFEFSKLAPAQMRDELQITLYQKGVAVSATYIRSGDRVVNTLPAPLAALANAIMHYSDCAKAAFG